MLEITAAYPAGALTSTIENLRAAAAGERERGGDADFFRARKRHARRLLAVAQRGVNEMRGHIRFNHGWTRINTDAGRARHSVRAEVCI